MKPVLNIYSYVRFSSLKQMDGNSIARQTALIDNYIEKQKENYDVKIIDAYRDLGISAFRGKNLKIGEIKNFLDGIEDGTISNNSVLIVEGFDRITRSRGFDAVALILSILNSNVKILTLDDNTLYDRGIRGQDSNQLFKIQFIVERANNESETKSARLKAAWKNRFDLIASGKKKVITGKTPWWLKIENGEYVLIPERVKEIKKVFNLLKTNGAQLTANKMNEDPERIKNWSLGAVQILSRNISVYGCFQAKHNTYNEQGSLKKVNAGEPVENFYPKAITKKEFELVRFSILARQNDKLRYSGRRPVNFKNIFSGITKCAHCGGSYRNAYRCSADKRYEYRYLICSNSQNGLCTSGIKNLSVNYILVEKAFFKYAKHYNLASILEKTKEENDFNNQIQLTELELSNKKEAFENMLQGILANNAGIIRPAYQTALDNAEAEITKTEKKLNKLRINKMESEKTEMSSISKILSATEMLEKKEMREKVNAHLKNIIESVVIENGKFTGKDYDTLIVNFKIEKLKHFIHFNKTKIWHSSFDQLNEIFDLISNDELETLLELDLVDIEDTGKIGKDGLPIYNLFSSNPELDLFKD